MFVAHVDGYDAPGMDYANLYSVLEYNIVP